MQYKDESTSQWTTRNAVLKINIHFLVTAFKWTQTRKKTSLKAREQLKIRHTEISQHLAKLSPDVIQIRIWLTCHEMPPSSYARTGNFSQL